MAVRPTILLCRMRPSHILIDFEFEAGVENNFDPYTSYYCLGIRGGAGGLHHQGGYEPGELGLDVRGLDRLDIIL